MVNFDIYTSSLFTISMLFLYIFNNYFNKYFSFYKDTNAVVQMSQAFQVRELQYPAYTSDYKHGCHGSIYKTVYTRKISKSSDFWLYVRSDTLYRETRITNAFYEVYALRCYIVLFYFIVCYLLNIVLFCSKYILDVCSRM